MTLRWVQASFALLVCGIVCAGVCADVVETADGRAENVRVQTIAGGIVFYTDSSNALQRASVEGVHAIEFKDIPALIDARRLERRGDFEEALQRLLGAYPQARTDAQRLWIRARLARLHNELGDYVEAAAHTAAVWVFDPSPAWLFLQPTCDLHETSFYAAGEAMEFLTRADRALAEEPNLHQAASMMRKKVEPVFQRLQAENEQLRYRNGSTISGFFTRDLGTDRTRKERPWLTEKPADTTRPAQPAQPTIREPGGNTSTEPASSPGRHDAGTDPANSPDAIEALLTAKKYAEALALCEQLTANTGNRDLAQYLYQYGRALEGVGRRLDATVQYMWCVAHFGGTVYGPRSLIRTALIYREELHKPVVANRLLDVAAGKAREINETELADQALGLKNL